MRTLTFFIIPLAVITAVGLRGCGKTTWIDADPAGCDAQLVRQANASQVATTQSAAQGNPASQAGSAGARRDARSTLDWIRPSTEVSYGNVVRDEGWFAVRRAGREPEEDVIPSVF